MNILVKIRRVIKNRIKLLCSYYSYESKVERKVKKLYPLHNIDDIVTEYIQKTGLNVKQHGNLILKEQIDKYIDKYLSDDQKADKQYLDSLILDITKCFLLYSLTVREYFNFELMSKSHEERSGYLSLKLKDSLVYRSLGKDAYKHYMILKDKNLFYKKASKWFKRDTCKVESNEDYASFVEFVNKHSRFIAKPSLGSHGWGTQILDLKDFESNPSSAFSYLLDTKTSWIVEELITQDQRMRAWNESSVNTLRIPSIRTKDGQYIIFYPYLRMGRKGSIVDNAGSGNPYAAIDAKTGIVCTDAMDEYGKHYVEHPDSGIPFVGFQIPKWDELVILCKEIHSNVLKEHRYIGFDFALSEKGWVVVEANWGTFTAQQSLIGHGIKDEFVKIMDY